MKKILFLTFARLLLNASSSFDTRIYVRVSESYTVYENVIEQIPVQECRNEKVPVNSSDLNLGKIVGGAAGGALGNQIGGGSGKTIATISGTIIGSSIGDKMANQNGKYEIRKICQNGYKQVQKRVLKGYNNIGYYRGQKIEQFSHEKLKEIPFELR